MPKHTKLGIIILYFCLLFTTCTPFKQVRTKIITETKIKFDTVIIYKSDTISKIQNVFITDTAFIESKESIAKSYFSTQKQKIVLELKGKYINVPVTIYKNVKTVEVKKEVIKNNKIGVFLDELIFGIIFTIIVILIIKDRKEIFK